MLYSFEMLAQSGTSLLWIYLSAIPWFFIGRLQIDRIGVKRYSKLSRVTITRIAATNEQSGIGL